MDSYKIEENIYAKETGVYGKSLFAKKDFKKEETVFVAFGPIVSEQNFYTIPVAYMPSLKGFLSIEPRKPEGNLSQYICHSCEPNLGIKNRTEFVAMREISKDEEITIDYAMIIDKFPEKAWEGWNNWECKCGRESCRGTVKGYLQLSENDKQKCQGYVSDCVIEAKQ